MSSRETYPWGRMGCGWWGCTSSAMCVPANALPDCHNSRQEGRTRGIASLRHVPLRLLGRRGLALPRQVRPYFLLQGELLCAHHPARFGQVRTRRRKGMASCATYGWGGAGWAMNGGGCRQKAHTGTMSVTVGRRLDEPAPADTSNPRTLVTSGMDGGGTGLRASPPPLRLPINAPT
jgi:hypothetical protein